MAGSTKSRTRKKRTNYKPLIIILIVLAAIVVISIGIGYFLTRGETVPTNEDTEQTETLSTDELKSMKTPLEGTWVSNYDGAILGINGLTFSLDMPSVDAPETVKGTIAVEQNLVTFIIITGDDMCPNMEGHYKFSFEDDEITFNLIKDNCDIRKERMTMSWFKL
ncbi:MAG: hypothetical protein KQH67_06530 [Bacteroidetes bacterium]|nr:hypothetical protein [Bacteroidota bacterium]